MSCTHRPISHTGEVTKPRLGEQGKKCEQCGNVSRNGWRNPFTTFFVSSPLLTRPHSFFLDRQAHPSVTYPGHQSNEFQETISKVKKLVVAYSRTEHARRFSAAFARLRCIVLKRSALLRKSCNEGGCRTQTYRRTGERRCRTSFSNLHAT